jgi:hypothetical protein
VVATAWLLHRTRRSSEDEEDKMIVGKKQHCCGQIRSVSARRPSSLWSAAWSNIVPSSQPCSRPSRWPSSVLWGSFVNKSATLAEQEMKKWRARPSFDSDVPAAAKLAPAVAVYDVGNEHPFVKTGQQADCGRAKKQSS